MALQKDAILSLKVQGFAEAEKHARLVAAFVDHASASTRSMEALVRSTGAAFVLQHDQIAKSVSSALKLESALERVEASARRAAGASRGLGGAPAGAPAIPGGGGGGALAGAGLKVAGVTAALYAAKAAGDALFDSIGRGESTTALGASFEKLAEKIGGSESAMTSLERATGGGVAKVDLMKAANRLLVTDLSITQAQLEGLIHSTAVLAKAQGMDATVAVDRMSMALAKQEPELLDELGIKVDLTKAIDDYARAHGVAAASIDAVTRSQIFATAAEEQAIDRAAKLAGTIIDVASSSQRASANWKNMTSEMDVLVSKEGSYSKAFEEISAAASKMTTALKPVFAQLGNAAGTYGAPAVGFYGDATARALEGGAVTANPIAQSQIIGKAIADTILERLGRKSESPLLSPRPGSGGQIELGPKSMAALTSGRASPGEVPWASGFGG